MQMTSETPDAITAEGLVREFDGLTAVDGIDLHIGRGEIYGFLGPNGAGKSTTVRVLCTLLSPTGGTAVVAGYDVATRPDQVRLRIGVALQEAALDPKQTGIELLRLQGRLYGLSRKDIDQRLEELGRLIDIGDALGRRIATYSGGMKRRLDLAAALVHNPEVLFLDEPTTGLDPVSRATMWEEVRRLNRELDMTIFLTTQYLEEADELADRVGIINGGRIVAEGAPDDLKRNVGNDLIVARVDGSAQAARGAVLAVAGVQGVETRDDEMTVDDDRRRVDDRRGGRRPEHGRAGASPHLAHADARRRLPRADRQPHPVRGRRVGHNRLEPTEAHRRRGGIPMTALDIATRPERVAGADAIHARPASFVRDVASIAGRALRAVPRELETVIPPIFIALFFFVVNIGTLQRVTQTATAGFDIKAFMMPTAILIGVTGVSRAGSLVLDIQDGYFDRLLLTPVSRLAILLGHMVADVVVAAALTVPILLLGLALGVHIESGVLGVLAFVALAGLWSLAFAGFGYAIALKTGNPAAVNSAFLLFFPFLFMTSSYVPRSQLSGWLNTIAAWNPVTYVLEGQRSLVNAGWHWDQLGSALLAVGVVAAISMSLCFAALRGRIKRG